MSPPLTIGLTGAVASGKSTALEILGRLGAATVSADQVAHDVLDSEPVLSRLRDRWGDEVVSEGRADRERIGGIVFADRAELAWLEAEIHPNVRERMAEWLTGVGEVKVAVAEVPLLFEGEMEAVFDLTIAVVAGDEARHQRAVARGHGMVAERDRRQLSQAEKAARADHVIENDGTPGELEAKLTSLLESLLQT